MNREVKFGNQALQVSVVNHGDRLEGLVQDGRTGKVWGPAPLFALEVHDRRLRRTVRTTQYRVDAVARVGNGVRVTVGIEGMYLSVGLWLGVEAGELVIRLAPDEIYERRPEVYRLFAVEPLPGMFRVGPRGSLLLPINQGMLCSPADKPALRDRFLVYMEQDRWELTTMLPVFGVGEGRSGMIGLMTAGPGDADCRVETDGRGHGVANFAFSLRRQWPDPVDPEVRELRLMPLAPKQELVLAAAKRLRRHALEDLGKQPLARRREESPELDYVLQAMTMKLFYGIEDEGADREGKADRGGRISYRDYMSFAEAAESLGKLKAAGIDKILTQSVGWNTRGHDGLYPTRFPVNERAGGEREFRRLIAAGQALGYHMNVHDNFMMNVMHSPDWDPECVTHDCYGQPLVHGWWAGGVEYASWPPALPPSRLAGHLARVKQLGIAGMFYADYMMQPLEVNYHPRWRGSRGDHLRGMMRIVAACRETFGAAAVEFGTFAGAIAADYITNCSNPGHLRGCDPEWPITRLFGTIVPVWQLALHGLVVQEGQPGTRWAGTMECILKGLHPRDEWSRRPGHHPVLDNRRIQALKAVYDLGVVRFGHLQGEELAACDWQSEVQTSKFADGTEVAADFRRGKLWVNGRLIPRPAALAP